MFNKLKENERELEKETKKKIYKLNICFLISLICKCEVYFEKSL